MTARVREGGRPDGRRPAAQPAAGDWIVVADLCAAGLLGAWAGVEIAQWIVLGWSW